MSTKCTRQGRCSQWTGATNLLVQWHSNLLKQGKGGWGKGDRLRGKHGKRRCLSIKLSIEKVPLCNMLNKFGEEQLEAGKNNSHRWNALPALGDASVVGSGAGSHAELDRTFGFTSCAFKFPHELNIAQSGGCGKQPSTTKSTWPKRPEIESRVECCETNSSSSPTHTKKTHHSVRSRPKLLQKEDTASNQLMNVTQTCYHLYTNCNNQYTTQTCNRWRNLQSTGYAVHPRLKEGPALKQTICNIQLHQVQQHKLPATLCLVPSKQ